ncbi:MAG: hypothetical protein LBB39_01390 [Mycoplasmataceae bacterium]|jgi:hypothetical protein|nr:hypothetical protein [Mycoplasmataceae bacterium]
MFNEMLNALLESKYMQYDSDGWYYPGERSNGHQESCIAFSFLIVTRFKQFHKYINQLLCKKHDGLYDDWKADAIEENDW